MKKKSRGMSSFVAVSSEGAVEAGAGSVSHIDRSSTAASLAAFSGSLIIVRLESLESEQLESGRLTQPPRETFMPRCWVYMTGTRTGLVLFLAVRSQYDRGTIWVRCGPSVLLFPYRVASRRVVTPRNRASIS